MKGNRKGAGWPPGHSRPRYSLPQAESPKGVPDPPGSVELSACPRDQGAMAEPLVTSRLADPRCPGNADRDPSVHNEKQRCVIANTSQHRARETQRALSTELRSIRAVVRTTWPHR